MSERAIVLFLATLILPACTVMNGEVLDNAVDRSLITGSIAAPPPPPDLEHLSDSRTVRNAVSAADVHAVASHPLSWTNAETGATGSITSIVEAREGRVVCRTFTTSRQRYDGVSLYGGETCMNGAGEWVLTRFSEGG